MVLTRGKHWSARGVAGGAGAALLVILAAVLFGPVDSRVALAQETPALKLVAPTVSTSRDRLREGGAAWAGIPEQTIHLNRTPPLYEGDPLDDDYRPEARVWLARAEGHLLVRLVWSDPSESRPAEPVRLPDAGESAVYKAHSQDVERFADAACVMLPQAVGEQKAYPALMMGDKGAPVDLYYWHLVRGFQKLTAAGRSTTTRSGPAFPGSARRMDGGWEVIFELPGVPVLTPLCFAVWDGDRSQRDGLKYYSLWYEVAS